MYSFFAVTLAMPVRHACKDALNVCGRNRARDKHAHAEPMPSRTVRFTCAPKADLAVDFAPKCTACSLNRLSCTATALSTNSTTSNTMEAKHINAAALTCPSLRLHLFCPINSNNKKDNRAHAPALLFPSLKYPVLGRLSMITFSQSTEILTKPPVPAPP